MAVTDRDLQSLKELIETNHEHIINTLELRRAYFDQKFNELYSAITEMKNHCVHVVDNCAIVFKDHDKRIDNITNDITRIKTVGGMLGFLWPAFLAALGHIVRKQ
jgi:diphthamide synthase (EF-2-diphthine--ammonia ligase)